MELTLSPELQRFVDEHVTSGRFRSASEVIESALAMLKVNEQFDLDHTEADLTEFRREVNVGLDAIREGRIHSPEAAWAYLMEQHAKQLKQ